MSFGWAFAGSALAAWAGCEAWGCLSPLRGVPVAQLVGRRTVRMIGRIVITLGVVAAGLWWRKEAPPAVGFGALLGWLAAAGREALSEQRSGAGGRRG